ncbi:MAG: alpha/beta fold hydrolase [Saprospiraceae bacterium]|nr:alpha/beta fold hydrolase [Saprospiraceae bacterium]
METASVQFRGSKITYYSQGTGTPVVLLHGFCEDSAIWEGYDEGLPGCRIIRIDLPGFGASQALSGASIGDRADAVYAVVSAVLSERFVLIGHSMGGYVSLAFAEKYPQLLLGLGLFHSHPFADLGDKKAGRDKSIAFIRQYGHVPFVRQLIPGVFAPAYVETHPSRINYLIDRATSYSAEAIIDALEAMRDRPDRSHVLRTLPLPVLFIIGRLDGSIPASQSMEQTHLPAVADIHVLEEAAHMGMWEAPEKTLRIVRDFVAFCLSQS